jgi:2,4-dienoyl-CoA reductase-like NADH-dependent reductase (Old Yellow Enzyme family)
MSILRTPLKIGKLEIRNRLVMPPMATGKSDADGSVSRALCQYYDEKTRGGHIGLIIAEHSYVSQDGKASNGQVSIAKDSDIAGLGELTKVVHRNGSMIFVQINHAGGAATRDVTGCDPISASAVRHRKASTTDELPKAMTREEIERIIRDFTRAAWRAREAGFDGVELHSAHGYLLNQFYSPLVNRRTDAYAGATLSGRIRLHLEIIHAIHAIVGDDFPIAIRLGACDYADGGSMPEDGVAASMAFADAGISMLDISGGVNGFTIPGVNGQGYFKDVTHAIKKRVDVPVLLTGGVVDAAAAEELLEAGDADLIGVGRAILQDSGWAGKAMESFS